LKASDSNVSRSANGSVDHAVLQSVRQDAYVGAASPVNFFDAAPKSGNPQVAAMLESEPKFRLSDDKAAQAGALPVEQARPLLMGQPLGNSSGSSKNIDVNDTSPVSTPYSRPADMVAQPVKIGSEGSSDNSLQLPATEALLQSQKQSSPGSLQGKSALAIDDSSSVKPSYSHPLDVASAEPNASGVMDGSSPDKALPGRPVEVAQPVKLSGDVSPDSLVQGYPSEVARSAKTGDQGSANLQQRPATNVDVNDNSSVSTPYIRPADMVAQPVKIGSEGSSDNSLQLPATEVLQVRKQSSPDSFQRESVSAIDDSSSVKPSYRRPADVALIESNASGVMDGSSSDKALRGRPVEVAQPVKLSGDVSTDRLVQGYSSEVSRSANTRDEGSADLQQGRPIESLQGQNNPPIDAPTEKERASALAPSAPMTENSSSALTAASANNTAVRERTYTDKALHDGDSDWSTNNNDQRQGIKDSASRNADARVQNDQKYSADQTDDVPRRPQHDATYHSNPDGSAADSQTDASAARVKPNENDGADLAQSSLSHHDPSISSKPDNLALPESENSSTVASANSGSLNHSDPSHDFNGMIEKASTVPAAADSAVAKKDELAAEPPAGSADVKAHIDLDQARFPVGPGSVAASDATKQVIIPNPIKLTGSVARDAVDPNSSAVALARFTASASLPSSNATGEPNSQTTIQSLSDHRGAVKDQLALAPIPVIVPQVTVGAIKQFTATTDSIEQSSTQGAVKGNGTILPPGKIAELSPTQRELIGVDIAITAIIAAAAISKSRPDAIDGRVGTPVTTVQTAHIVPISPIAPTSPTLPPPIATDAQASSLVAGATPARTTDGQNESALPGKKSNPETRELFGAELIVTAMIAAAAIAKSRNEPVRPNLPNGLPNVEIMGTANAEANLATIKTTAQETASGKILSGQNTPFEIEPSCSKNEIAEESQLPALTIVDFVRAEIKSEEGEASSLEDHGAAKPNPSVGAATSTATRVLSRPTCFITRDKTLVDIAEDLFHNGDLAWLIADLNMGQTKDLMIDGKRVVEFTSRQQITLPVWEDIAEFQMNHPANAVARNLITVVADHWVDRELLNSTLNFVSMTSRMQPLFAGSSLA
jgi:hypothetical protein